MVATFDSSAHARTDALNGAANYPRSVESSQGDEFLSPESLAHRLGGPKARRSGNGWVTLCPAHDDRNPSLSVTTGDGGATIVRCHAGCSQDKVIAALTDRGVTLTPPRDRARPELSGHFWRTTPYSYTDEAGNVIYQNVRREQFAKDGTRLKKEFHQRVPEGSGWINNLCDTRRVPYRLHELVAKPGQDVHATEGEKDTDAIAALGLLATSIATPEKVDLSTFDGRTVYVHEDNDAAGRTKSRKVADALHRAGAIVRLVRYPELPIGRDVSDWLAAGHTLEDLLTRCEDAPAWSPEQKSCAVAHTSEDGSDTDIKPWPLLCNIGAYGLVAEIARLATRASEADPNAVMATALAWGAAAFGRARFMSVGDTQHHSRHFAALVGASSRARKGTSLDPVRRIFKAAESVLQSDSSLSFPRGLSLKLSHGPLSSGEGLLSAIRDKRDAEDTGGVEDKRLLCIEGEFGSVLRACQRQGNTLSTTLRVAWDGWTLEPLTKHDKVCATDPHICVVGHITGHELKQLLTVSDLWNGFANRFLWIAVRRSATIPFPKPMPDDDVDRVAIELARVVAFAHSCTGERARLVLSNSAQDHWPSYYREVTQDHPGILGAVTSRAEAQVLRLSMTFALFDGADRVELPHLEAAIAFWRYAFDSAAYIFGGAELDPVAQKILDALASGSKTQTEISNLFDRHLPKDRLTSVLSDLQDRGRITLTTEKTGGAPRKIWSQAPYLSP